MNKIIKYTFLLLVVFITSCNSFLEPKSQSEFVPQLIQSLDELLLGEAYMGPGLNDGRFFSVLGVFDDDVSGVSQTTGGFQSITLCVVRHE